MRRLKPQLASKYGVNELGLFGSITRDDFSTDSDVDIVVDFDRSIGVEFIDLANELEAILHRKVDLISKKGIKPKYLKEIQKDLIYV
ncbi:nucleotidyltransferase family protein [Parapedobacter defluvii]|uniref:nucleotidyltransferase family protein n=1 Tax=Parapedobacter defluvii TaxID=2045106 RepID=UPI001E404F2E|nr:nucleotidyltransferase family protein [Parapedobacter defluvii]